MAIIIRKKAGFVSGTITDNPLLVGATTMNGAALANIPAVVSPDICVLVLDPTGSAGAPEIVYITAHTAAATSATIARGKESTTARQHLQTVAWVHMPTIPDFLPDNTTAGHLLTVTDANDGIATWIAPADKIYRLGHTWTISGTIAVPSGDTDFICPFYVDLITGQTVAIAGYKAVINAGTSVTLDVKVNGSNATGFTAISVTTTAGGAFPGNVSLSDGDKVAIVVSAVSGTPKNMSFSLFLEYTQ